LKERDQRIELLESDLKEYQMIGEKWLESEQKINSEIEHYRNNYDYIKAELDEKKSSLDTKSRELNMLKLELKNMNNLKGEVKQ